MVDFHKRILFSDEAHFWLNGYVNKQNCLIWSEANPQVYVETPLHPEKLTVWYNKLHVSTKKTIEGSMSSSKKVVNCYEIVTSVQEESDTIDDEADENEDNNKDKSSKGSSNAHPFSALETAMEWYKKQSECCPTQLLLLKKASDLAEKKRRLTMVQRKISDYFTEGRVRFHILHRLHSVFGYPNNHVSERLPIPIDSDKPHYTVLLFPLDG
ncbi:uncharacterized protein TNCV_5096921 [Trichonephila clavipes]|nr:uncharacterized protein TNCV_5096921 [Trichonephila clavipes]